MALHTACGCYTKFAGGGGVTLLIISMLGIGGFELHRDLRWSISFARAGFHKPFLCSWSFSRSIFTLKAALRIAVRMSTRVRVYRILARKHALDPDAARCGETANFHPAATPAIHHPPPQFLEYNVERWPLHTHETVCMPVEFVCLLCLQSFVLEFVRSRACLPRAES